MATLWQLFPGIRKPENKVQIFPAAVSIMANLGAGKYDFTGKTAFGFKANSGDMCVIDGVTMSANVPASVFSSAIDPAIDSGFVSLDIVRAGNGHSCTLAPFRFATFEQSLPFSATFEATATENNEEEFFFKVGGALLQTAELIAVSSIEIKIIANIYRMKKYYLEETK